MNKTHALQQQEKFGQILQKRREQILSLKRKK